MARLIDADALKKKWQDVLDAKADEKDTVAYLTFELFIDRLKEEPTVDAVEVVRCRECKYWQDNNGGYPHEDCRWGKNETPEADDYCSYGERR